MSDYPRKNDAGETIWACCVSSIGPVCGHRREPDTFRQFMARIDYALITRVGVSSLDLPDYAYRDAFDDEVPVSEVVADVLSET